MAWYCLPTLKASFHSAREGPTCRPCKPYAGAASSQGVQQLCQAHGLLARVLHDICCLTQSLALPILLNGHPGLIASELHQVRGKSINSQALASLLNQQPVKGAKEDKASAETLLVTAFYSRGLGRGLSKACDGSAEGLLRGDSACDLALHDLGRGSCRLQISAIRQQLLAKLAVRLVSDSSNA